MSRFCLWLETDCSQAHLCPCQCFSGGKSKTDQVTKSPKQNQKQTKKPLEAHCSQANICPCQCFSSGLIKDLPSDTTIKTCQGWFWLNVQCSVHFVGLFPNLFWGRFNVFNLQVFSKTIKSNQKKKPTKFAIDLRSPEEIEQDLKNELDTECWPSILGLQLLKPNFIFGKS